MLNKKCMIVSFLLLISFSAYSKESVIEKHLKSCFQNIAQNPNFCTVYLDESDPQQEPIVSFLRETEMASRVILSMDDQGHLVSPSKEEKNAYLILYFHQNADRYFIETAMNGSLISDESRKKDFQFAIQSLVGMSDQLR